MKKKILILVMVLFVIIPMTSCSLLYPDLYSEESSSTAEITEPIADTIISEKPVELLQNSYTSVISDVYNSCVGVYGSFSGDSAGTGSGVVYKKEAGYYYVVTNNHVVYNFDTAEEGKIKIYIESKIESNTNANKNAVGKYYSAEIMGRDEAHDLAVLRFSTELSGENGPIIPLDIFNESVALDSIIEGQSVIAIGCPGGFDRYNSASVGIISQVDNGYLYHDAAINPGNSGGGLFNLAGRLIGLNFQKRTSFQESDGSTISSEGLGEAIGIQILLTQIPKLEVGNKFGAKPLIGIEIGTIIENLTEDEALLEILPDNMSQAIYVSKFATNSITGEIDESYSGYKSGLKINDIIYEAKDVLGNSIKISNVSDLSAILLEMHYGDTLNLKVIRDGAYVDISFVLTEPIEN